MYVDGKKYICSIFFLHRVKNYVQILHWYFDYRSWFIIIFSFIWPLEKRWQINFSQQNFSAENNYWYIHFNFMTSVPFSIALVKILILLQYRNVIRATKTSKINQKWMFMTNWFMMAKKKWNVNFVIKLSELRSAWSTTYELVCFFKYFYVCYLDSHCTTFSRNHRKEPAKGSIAFFIGSCPLNQ